MMPLRIQHIVGGDLIMTKPPVVLGLSPADLSCEPPPKVDWRFWSIPFDGRYDDQGNRGFCWAYASTQMAEGLRYIAERKKGQLDPQPVIKRGKEISGRAGDGETLEVAIQAAKEIYGSFGQETWVGNLDELRTLVAWNGPVLCGAMITDHWQTVDPATGRQGNAGNGAELGGHAFLCVGYDMQYAEVYCWTSWKYGWVNEGRETGFFRIPMDRFKKEFFGGVGFRR